MFNPDGYRTLMGCVGVLGESEEVFDEITEVSWGIDGKRLSVGAGEVWFVFEARTDVFPKPLFPVRVLDERLDGPQYQLKLVSPDDGGRSVVLDARDRIGQMFWSFGFAVGEVNVVEAMVLEAGIYVVAVFSREVVSASVADSDGDQTDLAMHDLDDTHRLAAGVVSGQRHRATVVGFDAGRAVVARVERAGL